MIAVSRLDSSRIGVTKIIRDYTKKPRIAGPAFIGARLRSGDRRAVDLRFALSRLLALLSENF